MPGNKKSSWLWKTVLILLINFIPEYVIAQITPDTLGVETPPGVELISKRTLKSKTYLNPESNILTTVISSGYLHYRDASGHLREINRHIVLSPDSTHYQVTRGLYHARFAFDLQGSAFPITFELKDSTRLRAKLTALAYYSRPSKQLVIIQPVQKSIGVVKGNKIRYPEAFTGIDVEYEYADTRLKQTSVPKPDRTG